MTMQKAAEKAAELANAQYGGDLWDANDFLGEGTREIESAFVQFIADADAAARELDARLATNNYVPEGFVRKVLSPFILPDEVDPLEEAIADVLASPGALTHKQICHHLRSALAVRGLEIAEIFK